ncbi:MAG: hypothetical protein HPY50_21525 [Firmicutes bacterium]|nr:hypothetical protein [Bacillota bacterium]
MGNAEQGSFIKTLGIEFRRLVEERRLNSAVVQVKASPLSPEEAIGSPERKDYVLLRGKERLVQADILGHRGQAFTDSLGDYQGILDDVLDLPLENNYQRAVYIASLNAVAAFAGIIGNTIHCRDQGPGECAKGVVDFFRKNYGSPKILMIGYQPAMAEALNTGFELVVLDLDPDNIGKVKNGVSIKDGAADLGPGLKWCDVIFATGSTICNNTIDQYYLAPRPLVLFGITGSAASALLDIPRYCPEST